MLKIQEIINLEMVKLVFLMKHDKLPGPIMDTFKKIGNKGVGIKKCRYNTRNKNTPNVLLHSRELFNKSFYVEGCQHFRNYKMEQGMQKI